VIPLEVCRLLLGPAAETMPDVEVERIRETLYVMAGVVIEGFELRGFDPQRAPDGTNDRAE
jgi:hypothetical protein